MLPDATTKLLGAPLSKDAVKTRQQAGVTLSYIEGWHVIAEANRIFGFGNWNRYTELEQLGEPVPFTDSHGNEKVRIVVVGEKGDNITRDGVGFGSGISKNIGDAYEGAVKEAETDATKRAFMTFGNPFGLALYDKEQKGVEDPKATAKEITHKIDTAQTIGAVNAALADERCPDLSPAQQDFLNKRAEGRRGMLAQAPGEAA